MTHMIKKFVIFSAVTALAMPALGALDALNGKEAQAFAKRGKKSSSKRSRSSRSSRSSSKRKASSARRTTTNRRTFTTNRRTVRRGPTTRRTVRDKRRFTTRHRVTHHHPYTSRRTTVTTRRRVIRNRPIQRRRVYRHRTHHHHHVAPRRTVTRTEVHHHHHSAPAPRVTNRRTVTTHTHTRTQVHHHHHHTTRRNVVVNRRYYGSGDTSGGSVATGTYPDSNRSSATLNPTEVYLTANAGLSGFASNQLVTDVLPGVGANLGFGIKKDWLAVELGFDLGGYRLDPASSQSDMSLYGVNADLKFQPSIFFLEPFVFVGVGGKYFNDHEFDATAAGGSLRVGGGLDFRVSQFALSAQYLYSQHGLFGEAGTRYDGELISAQSDMLSLGVKVYF